MKKISVSAIALLCLTGMARAEPVLVTCHMGYCSWEELISETVVVGGDLNSGYLVERVAVTFGTEHAGDYPSAFSSDLVIESKTIVRNQIFCSVDRPTVVYENFPITSLNMVQPYGYELSSAIVYARTCHGLMGYPDDSAVNALLSMGYTQNGGQTFESLEHLVGSARDEAQSDLKKVGHFFRVVGVASNDVLNVRALPDADSPILAVLPPDTPLLDAFSVSADGKWFEVNAAEGTGWIRNRFVEEVDVRVFRGTDIPSQLTCFANEPFIEASFDDAFVSFTGSGQTRTLSLSSAQVLRSSPPEVVLTGVETGETIVVSNAICNDEAGRKFPYTMISTYYQATPSQFCCTLR